MEINITKLLCSTKQINECYNKLSNLVAEECGITRPEADILLFLSNNPSYDRAKDIVKLRSFSKAYVSKAVELLANKGLITIEVDKQDRRNQHIYITKRAMRYVEQLQEMQVYFFRKLVKGVEEENITLFMQMIEQFAENAKNI